MIYRDTMPSTNAVRHAPASTPEDARTTLLSAVSIRNAQSAGQAQNEVSVFLQSKTYEKGAFCVVIWERLSAPTKQSYVGRNRDKTP
jgi:hypothetical protein